MRGWIQLKLVEDKIRFSYLGQHDDTTLVMETGIKVNNFRSEMILRDKKNNETFRKSDANVIFRSENLPVFHNNILQYEIPPTCNK